MNWIFTILYTPEGTRNICRRAIVGPAQAATVEAAFHLASLPAGVRAEIRADATVRLFVEGSLDPEGRGYYIHSPPQAFPMSPSWVVCIGAVHKIVL